MIPAALLAHVWPVLRACRGGPLALVRVSLTAPRGRDVRSPALDLATWVAARPRGGAVLVLDRRPRDGAEHWYGIALVHDHGAELVAHWCALTGANAKGQAVVGVTGWSEHMEGDAGTLRSNMERVLRYAFRVGPAEHGPRDLDRDVIACGSLAASWSAARAFAKGEGAPEPGDAREASPAAGEPSHRCPRCERPLPMGRCDRKWCSPKCRNAAYRARKET